MVTGSIIAVIVYICWLKLRIKSLEIQLETEKWRNV